MRSQWIIGNWKMNGSLSANAALLNELIAGTQEKGSARMAVCAPYPYLAQVQAALANSNIAYGAQNLSDKASGAYTGEVSADMLKDFGVQLVLIGHSERRSLYGETDAVVAEKSRVALEAGLTPVICVGETLSERESGQAQAVVLRQLKAVADVIKF